MGRSAAGRGGRLGSTTAAAKRSARLQERVQSGIQHARTWRPRGAHDKAKLQLREHLAKGCASVAGRQGTLVDAATRRCRANERLAATPHYCTLRTRGQFLQRLLLRGRAGAGGSGGGGLGRRRHGRRRCQSSRRLGRTARHQRLIGRWPARLLAALGASESWRAGLGDWWPPSAGGQQGVEGSSDGGPGCRRGLGAD